MLRESIKGIALDIIPLLEPFVRSIDYTSLQRIIAKDLDKVERGSLAPEAAAEDVIDEMIHDESKRTDAFDQHFEDIAQAFRDGAEAGWYTDPDAA
jgi:hypothetical protein